MTKNEPRECKCGCGDWTRGGTFRPGHDARYHAAQKQLHAQAVELIGYFEARRNEHWTTAGNDWLARAARRFADSTATSHMGMALDLLQHPRMQDTEYNRRNGYLPYTTPAELWSRILRVCS